MNAESFGLKCPALVFLHHFGGSSGTWDGVIARLGASFEAIAFDLPGFGAEAAARGPFTVHAYADFVAARVRSLGLHSYMLIGHSMGGKIALALAARRPTKLDALILLAPSPPTPEPIEEAMRSALIAGWGQYNAASQILGRITAAPLPLELRERAIADMMACGKCAWDAWLEEGCRENISASLGRIEVPVTILSGDRDDALPTALIEREVAGRLARVRLLRVDGAGHLLPLEAPDAVVAAIRQVAGEASQLRSTAKHDRRPEFRNSATR